jgi:hypothetical protein
MSERKINAPKQPSGLSWAPNGDFHTVFDFGFKAACSGALCAASRSLHTPTGDGCKRPVLRQSLRRIGSTLSLSSTANRGAPARMASNT